MLRVDLTGARPGTSFTLPQTSAAGAPTFVVLNGQILNQVLTGPTTTECILSGASVTTGATIVAADDFFAFIQTTATRGLIQTVLTGVQNGSNLVYTLATAPPAGSSLMYYFNGGLLNEVGAAPTPQQMTRSGTTVTMGAAPSATDFLIAYIEDAASLTFLHALTMQGSGVRWTIARSFPSQFLPVLHVFVNGQLQQEVTTFPVATQYRQSVANSVLTLILGMSLTSSDVLQVLIVGLRAGTAAPSLPVYLDMQNELLVLMNEQIDLQEAKMCLNRRWQKLLQAWSWSFVKADGVLTTKAPKSAGTLTVTQDSTLVIGASTSFATTDIGAYLVLGDQPYLVLDVQVLSATSQILLINSSYPGTTSTTLKYQLYYKDYALDPDVIDILSMAGPSWPLNEITQEGLDVEDSDRSFVGQPSFFARRGMVDGIYRVELWPIPDARYTIHYVAVNRSVLTDKGQFIPDVAEVLLMSAEELACGIVSSKNAAEKNYEGAAFWAGKGNAKHGNYQESLEELKSKDRRRFGRNAGNRVRSLSAYRETPGYDVGWRY